MVDRLGQAIGATINRLAVAMAQIAVMPAINMANAQTAQNLDPARRQSIDLPAAEARRHGGISDEAVRQHDERMRKIRGEPTGIAPSPVWTPPGMGPSGPLAVPKYNGPLKTSQNTTPNYNPSITVTTNDQAAVAGEVERAMRSHSDLFMEQLHQANSEMDRRAFA